MKKWLFNGFFALLLAFTLTGTWSAISPSKAFVSAEVKVSAPGQYSGYSPMLYDGWKRFSQYVAVRDGTKLAVDIFRPTLSGQVVSTPYPVIYSHTPYLRASYRADGSISLSGKANADYLTKYGYVVVVADERGKGASYGTRRGFNDRTNANDLYDMIEWLAAQPWCDGKVGMSGCSHLGGVQYHAASAMPPHLKAIFPWCCPFNLYDDQFVRGGILRNMNPATYDPPYTNDYKTVPVDGDIDGNGDGYADMLYNAVQQHIANTQTVQMFTSIPYRDSISPLPSPPGTLPLGQFWFEGSISTYVDQIESLGIPIYHYGLWNDDFRRSAFLAFANMDNPDKIMINGPYGHCGTGSFNSLAEHHRFFDYCLKGIQNGIMDEPPIYYNVMGAATGTDWRFAWQWPLPNEKQTKFYLSPGPSGSTNPGVNDGTLTTTAPVVAGVKDDYTVFYEITNQNRDAKGLTYTTQPLASDVEITGHPVINLWVSSTATDGDFFVFLEDVDTTGLATIVTRFQQRASLRSLDTPPWDNLGLPWHRNYATDVNPLALGQPVKLVFDLLPTSQLFKAGHRIRLTITCSEPSTAITPKLDPPPVVSIHRNTTYASYITLPITTDPLNVATRIEPATFNLKSNGTFTVFITPSATLPDGYHADDINIATVKCNGATVIGGKVAKDTLVAKFRTQDLIGVTTGDKVTLTVTGEFQYKIPFTGSAIIRVIK